MHLPPYNAELRPTVLRQFIRDNPLGIFTTAIRSPAYPLLQTSHFPWIVDVDQHDSETELGKLRGHMARQNPQAKAIVESFAKDSSDANATPSRESYLEEDVLVLFNGPVHHYVTPHFYAETKPKTGKVVPTWDYEAVQVNGRARIFFDTHSPDFDAFLTQQLSDLSQHAETSIMGYGTSEEPESRAWQVADAPERYIDVMKKNIIGIEITIKSMAGRFKMSQEKIKGDRDGVINGFQKMKSVVGPEIADVIIRRAEQFDAQKAEKQSS